MYHLENKRHLSCRSLFVRLPCLLLRRGDFLLRGGLIFVLLLFAAPACKTPKSNKSPKELGKGTTPLSTRPRLATSIPSVQTKTVPLSKPSTRPAVLARPTSRPTPLRPGQKDKYGRELIFTFRSLVDGAALSEARVYGKDRPRIIVLTVFPLTTSRMA
jgi:hypothetical protein